MTRTVQRAALLTALLLSSCAPTLQEEIDRNERVWTSLSIPSYQIEVLQVRSIWHAQVYTVTVENGLVSDSSTSCIPAPFEGDGCEVELYDPEDFTAPGLFRTARSQAESVEAGMLTIRFNRQFGYPETIRLDDPNALDDEVSWQVRRFEVQP